MIQAHELDHGTKRYQVNGPARVRDRSTKVCVGTFAYTGRRTEHLAAFDQPRSR